MIHINTGENNEHEWLTDEEFAERFPDLQSLRDVERSVSPEVQRLKLLRREKRITLRKLSERIELSFTILSRIENGQEQPTKSILEDIEKALSS